MNEELQPWADDLTVDEMKKEINALRLILQSHGEIVEENARLREALEFYANGVAVDFDHDDVREQEDSEWCEEHQLYFKGKRARKVPEGDE